MISFNSNYVGAQSNEWASKDANETMQLKKNWTRFDAQAAASLARRRVGRRCDGHFATSVHPRIPPYQYRQLNTRFHYGKKYEFKESLIPWGTE